MTEPITSAIHTVGVQIKSKRKERGMSQKELAVSSGHSSPAYIALIEKGERNVSINSLYAISLALHVPIAFLFGDMSEYKKGFDDGWNRAMEEVRKKIASIDSFLSLKP